MTTRIERTLGIEAEKQRKVEQLRRDAKKAKVDQILDYTGVNRDLEELRKRIEDSGKYPRTALTTNYYFDRSYGWSTVTLAWGNFLAVQEDGKIVSENTDNGYISDYYFLKLTVSLDSGYDSKPGDISVLSDRDNIVIPQAEWMKDPNKVTIALGQAYQQPRMEYIDHRRRNYGGRPKWNS